MKKSLLLTIPFLASAEASSAAIMELTVTPGVSSTNLVFSVTGDDGASPYVEAFVVHREEFTGLYLEGCRTRVEVAVLPRPIGTASYSFQIQDTALPLGRAFHYSVGGGPPQGVLPVGFDYTRSSVFLTTGTALIAAAADVRATPNGLEIVSCGCLAWLTAVQSAPSEIIDSTEKRRLYGQIQPGVGYRSLLIVESGTPPVDDCTDFAVLPSTWATVKSLYQ